MTTYLAETYRHKSNDELLRLVRGKDSLQEGARQALNAEMEKRGMGEGAAVRFEEQEREANEPAAKYVIVQKQTGGSWIGNLMKCILIFGAAAILTVVIADSIFKPPNEAVRILTEMSLKAALALAFLASAVGSRWLTFKRIVISAVIFSVALFGFIVWVDATARHH